MKPWKIQKLVEDVVYDLRSRGLLPVVIALVVAMVAVPILISHGGSDSSGGSVQAAAGAPQAPPETKEAVVSYTPPGIRDYKKRLQDATAKDPFRQQFAPPASTASQLESTVPVQADSETASAAGGGSATSAPSSSGGSVEGSGTSSGSASETASRSTKTHRYYFYSVADVSVGDATQPLTRHKKLKAFTVLPDQVAPVMVYLGSSVNGKQAFFSISKSVTQLTGPGTCAPSPTDCSLLVLRSGQSEDMVNPVDGKTYRVKVNKINQVTTKNPPAT